MSKTPVFDWGIKKQFLDFFGVGCVFGCALGCAFSEFSLCFGVFLGVVGIGINQKGL